MHTDARFSTAIEAVVAEIERRTDAEVIVVAAPRSGTYRDLAWLGGLIVAAGVLAFLCWSPVVFDARWWPVEVLAAGLLVGWALDRYALSAKLAGEVRRRRQVREAAFAAFAEENVHATSDRTGVLVYVSAVEARVEIVADQGLQGRIPGAAWNALDVRADTLDALIAGLRRLGELLAAHVPATGENPDQVANAPRVRS